MMNNRNRGKSFRKKRGRGEDDDLTETNATAIGGGSKQFDDGHIDQMSFMLAKSKKKNKQKKKLKQLSKVKNTEKQQPKENNKKKANQQQTQPKKTESKPQQQSNKRKSESQKAEVKSKKRKQEESEDLLFEDELMNEDEDDDFSDDGYGGSSGMNYNSDESEIIDDLDEEELKNNKDSTAVFITKEMLEGMAKDEEDPDDKVIAYLEKKLKIKKNKGMDELDQDPGSSNLEDYVKEKRLKKQEKKKPKAVVEESDGEDTIPGYVEPKIDEDDLGEFDEDFEGMFGDIDPDDMVNLDAEIDAMIESEQQGMDYSEFLKSEVPTLATIIEKSKKSSGGSSSTEAAQSEESEAAPSGKYIPPHMRKQQILESGRKSESYIALQKSIRNLLNKLSLANISSITKESLALYEKSSKNDFHDILSNSIIESVCDSVDLQSNFILVYAAYMAAMHNIGGTSIGAHFIEKLIQKFDSIIDQRHQASNLLTLICHVYNLGLIYCGLIYDIIRMFCLNINELNVEYLFKLLQACGFQLKIDDPAAMKDIIEIIKSSFEKYEDTVKDEGSAVAKRMKFLVEMIYDLRNNRKRQYQEDISEQYKQLKQSVKDLQKQEKKTGENTLRIPYIDLIEAEKKGRWWLVGSAWTGNQFGSEADNTNATSLASMKNRDNISMALNDMDPKLIKKLEKLAKEQRMTTDLRRAVFCILMGSEDFIDAFQRLVKLGIQKNNREIARVLLHCCCQEKGFNPYYSKLAEKLCSVENTNRAFQFTFYEYFDDLSKNTVRKLINISKLLSELIGKGCLSLSMLKIIDFNSLQQLDVVLFRLLFLNLLLDFTEVETTRCFFRLSKVEEHDSLKESLILFLYQFVKKEFRRGFIYDLLALKDITKKGDKTWMKEQENVIKLRANMMRKVLRADISVL